MKNQFFLFSISFFAIFFSERAFSQTPITNANFSHAITTCLSTNPVDGMCTSSEYGAMPNWDVSNITNMNYAFANKSSFNANISNWDVGNVTKMHQMFLLCLTFNQPIGN